MNGSLIKRWTLFNHSLNLSILGGAVPNDWHREYCLEYFDEVNFNTDSSVVVISCMGYDIMHALEIAEKFRSKGKLVIYGAHMDNFSEGIMNQVCDSVFYGVPTPANMMKMLDDILLNCLQPEYHFGMDIDFPFDYSMLKEKKMPFIQTIGSQGCVNKCKYCCTASVFKGRYRLRKIDCIIKDLKSIRAITKYVSFIDPNIFNNREYLKRLCSRIISEKIGIRWGAQATINIGNEPEVLERLYKSGCRVLFIGLETLEQVNLEQFGKNYLSEEYAEQIKKIKKAGIHVVGYFMLGMDGDTADTFETTYKFIQQSHMVLPIINILLPVPGTEMFEMLKNEDRLLIEDIDKFYKDNPLYSVPCQHAFFIPKNLSAPELEKGFVHLAERLFTRTEIIKRSIVPNPVDSVKILLMNFELRKKYMVMGNAAS